MSITVIQKFKSVLQGWDFVSYAVSTDQDGVGALIRPIVFCWKIEPTGGFDSGVSFQKLMTQHNLYMNIYSVYSEEVKPYSMHSNVEAAAAPKHQLKQKESHDVFDRYELLKLVIFDGPKRLHFVNLESSIKVESIEHPNSCITDTK